MCVAVEGGGFHFSRFLQRITFAVRCKNGFCHSRQLCVRAGFIFVISDEFRDYLFDSSTTKGKKKIRSSNQITNDTFRSNVMNLELKKRRIISLYFGTNARHVQCDNKYWMNEAALCAMVFNKFKPIFFSLSLLRCECVHINETLLLVGFHHAPQFRSLHDRTKIAMTTIYMPNTSFAARYIFLLSLSHLLTFFFFFGVV